MLANALVTFCIGLALYLLRHKLNNRNSAAGHKKTFADYHGELTIAAVVFFGLSFVSLCFWLWLNFVVAR
jgi:hypothetical protein